MRSAIIVWKIYNKKIDIKKYYNKLSKYGK